MTRFSEELKNQNIRLWERICSHPFIEEMIEGNLPLEKFRFYIAQDDLFLEEFCKFIEITILENEDHESWLSELLDVTRNIEMEMHKKLYPKIGLTPEFKKTIKLSVTTRSYFTYFFRVSDSGTFPEIISVMTPCPWTYFDIGKKMMVKNTEHEVYSLWCDFYSSEESREGVEHLRSLLDDVAEKTTLEIKNNMMMHFSTAMRYEYMFWNMSYRMENRHWDEWSV